MDIPQRDGEDQAPRHGRKPSFPALAGTRLAAADDVVAMIDRPQERGHMGLAPRFLGGSHQYQGQLRTLQSAGKRTT